AVVRVARCGAIEHRRYAVILHTQAIRIAGHLGLRQTSARRKSTRRRDQNATARIVGDNRVLDEKGCVRRAGDEVDAFAGKAANDGIDYSETLAGRERNAIDPTPDPLDIETF